MTVEGTEGKEGTEEVEGTEKQSFGSVVYECIYCGTQTSSTELASLPEVKCICGYKVFRKVRSPVVKQLKAI
ncbi:MAG: RNA polymerase Rbp10 [Thaumarchaeota archaeon]|nr:RNA polymerase Rbp10 [Nitrososphaerota archaeon]